MLVLFPHAAGSRTARVRVRMPLGLCWEDTKRVRIRVPGGRWVALVYLRRHIWTTCGRWPKLDVDHVEYDVQQVGPFVLACRDIF